jgi:hypothetical protein
MCCMFCWENSVLRFQKMIYKLWVTQVRPLPSYWHQCVMRCMSSSMGNLQVWHSHLYAFSCSGFSQDNNSNKSICLWINQTKVLEFLSPPNILSGGGLWVWAVDQVVQWAGMYKWIRKSVYKQAATALHYSQWQLVCKCVPASSWLLTHCLSEFTELVNSQFKTTLNMHPNCLLMRLSHKYCLCHDRIMAHTWRHGVQVSKGLCSYEACHPVIWIWHLTHGCIRSLAWEALFSLVHFGSADLLQSSLLGLNQITGCKLLFSVILQRWSIEET